MARSQRRRVAPEDVARYYADLTVEYESYGGAARSWNYGVWEPGVRTHQDSLQRGKEVLLRGLDVGPDSRVLDVGCGGGGFAVWCAERFGCRVTAITICDEHVALAEEYAAEMSVADRCEFRCMDMDRLGFADESFDVVTNHDSFCHSASKRRYLREVFRVLAKGGVWSCIDFNLRSGAISRAEAAEVRKVLSGFHIASLATLAKVLADMKAVGFEACTATELGPAVLPSAALIMRSSREPLRLARRHPRRRLHSPDPAEEANLRGHFEAGMAYSIGLHTGLFEHGVYRARKPVRR